MIPQCYTLPEVAALLNISKSTLYRQAREDRLPEWMGAMRVGRATRFPKHIIDAKLGGAAA